MARVVSQRPSDAFHFNVFFLLQNDLKRSSSDRVMAFWLFAGHHNFTISTVVGAASLKAMVVLNNRLKRVTIGDENLKDRKKIDLK